MNRAKNLLKRWLPERLIGAMGNTSRMVNCFITDIADKFTGRRNELTPSKRQSLSIGTGDFNEIGKKIFHHLVQLCQLKPHERVLDVGCGIGRAAVPLTQYLKQPGSYEGFDIVPENIHWCQEKITPKFPHFKFQVVDVFNSVYNPKGRTTGENYQFPFQSSSFDVIFLTSVFSHMLPEELENYLKEISRLLKPGGRCLITYFLLNSESLDHLKLGKSSILFDHDYGIYRLTSKLKPEAAVAYQENFIAGLYKKYGLQIKHPIHYGAWCGRPNGMDYQDIIIAYRQEN